MDSNTNCYLGLNVFLSERNQSVLIDGHLSQYRPVISGVVQGSQIGPLLFIIFVNDIVDLLEEPSVCKLFADDIKLYSRIESSSANALELSLQKIQE